MSLNDNMWILPSAIVGGAGAGIWGGFAVAGGSFGCFGLFS